MPPPYIRACRSADLVAPPLSPGLDQLKVTSPERDAANAKVTSLQAQLADAISSKATAAAALIGLHSRDKSLSHKLTGAQAQKRLALRRLAVLRSAIEQMAVASYVGGGLPRVTETAPASIST